MAPIPGSYCHSTLPPRGNPNSACLTSLPVSQDHTVHMLPTQSGVPLSTLQACLQAPQWEAVVRRSTSHWGRQAGAGGRRSAAPVGRDRTHVSEPAPAWVSAAPRHPRCRWHSSPSLPLSFTPYPIPRFAITVAPACSIQIAKRFAGNNQQRRRTDLFKSQYPGSQPLPASQVFTVHTPLAQPGVACATVQALLQAPQWAAVVRRLTSQPFDGSTSQLPKPATWEPTEGRRHAEEARALQASRRGDHVTPEPALGQHPPVPLACVARLQDAYAVDAARGAVCH